MSVLHSTSPEQIDGAAIRTRLHSLLIAEDDQTSARDLLTACLVVGAFWLLGLAVPELVTWFEHHPTAIHWVVFAASAVLGFRGLGLVPTGFLQYLVTVALLMNGFSIVTAFETKLRILPPAPGPQVHPPPFATLFAGVYVFVFYVLVVPFVAGFVLGRLGRVANDRYGPALAALRDQDDH